MDRRNDTAVEAILEQLIEQGPGGIAGVFARAFELAMQIERERFLGAGHYERTPERRGYANGTKPKRIDTPAGTVIPHYSPGRLDGRSEAVCGRFCLSLGGVFCERQACFSHELSRRLHWQLFRY